MKKLSILPLFALFIVACGGGGHHGSSGSTGNSGTGGTTGVADHIAVALGVERDASGNSVVHLATFHTNTPSTFLTDVAVIGIDSGDKLAAIDQRPSTGVLYGVGAQGTLYMLDPTTGVATKVGATNPVAGHQVADMDFDPSGSQVRVSSFYNNTRLDPSTGAKIADDPLITLNGNEYDVSGLAYAPSGVLYTYNFTQKLLKIATPNTGVLSSYTSATLPFFGTETDTNNPLNEEGMDISADGKTAILASFGLTESSIVLVDLATGVQKFSGSTPSGLFFQTVSVAFFDTVQGNHR